MSLKDRRCIGVGLGLSQQEALYFEVLPEPSPHLPLIERLLASPDITKVYHNALFDLSVLADWQPDASNIQDVSLMAQVQGLPAQLKELAYRYLGQEIDEISDILPPRQNMLDLDFKVVAHKCMKDCQATLGLFLTMGGGVGGWGHDSSLWGHQSSWGSRWGHQPAGSHSDSVWTHTPNWHLGADPWEPTTHTVTPGMQDCYEVDRRLIPLLLRMSRRGIALRQDRVSYWYERLSREALHYKDICDREGFNPNSPQQVGYVLASRGNILPFTKSRKQLKANEEVLMACPDPLAAVVLEHRWRTKLVGTYLAPSLGQDRFYTHFRQDVATGRLASYDRNIQNIPSSKKRPEYTLRDMFAPDSGIWTDADWNEIEMRVFAHTTQDPTLLQAYKDGISIHTLTQQALWPGSDPADKAARLRAKTFNFGGVLFDASPKVIEANTGIPAAQCAEYKARWYRTYARTRPWIDEQKRLGTERGYQETLFGRRMQLPRLGETTETHREKCAVNYPIQGTAADIIKRAMLRLSHLAIAAQVHDELLIDGSDDLPEELDYVLEGLYTPFEVIRGPVWP